MLAMVATGCLLGWWFTADHYQGRIAKADLARSAEVNRAVTAQLDAAIATERKRIKAEETRVEEKITVAAAASAAAGVRIHIPCRSAMQGAATTKGNPNKTAGVLPGGVDEAFAELQAKAGTLLGEADELNLEARRMNAELGPAE